MQSILIQLISIQFIQIQLLVAYTRLSQSVGRAVYLSVGWSVRHAVRKHTKSRFNLSYSPCPLVRDWCGREYGHVSYSVHSNSLQSCKKCFISRFENSFFSCFFHKFDWKKLRWVNAVTFSSVHQSCFIRIMGDLSCSFTLTLIYLSFFTTKKILTIFFGTCDYLW